MDTLYASSNTCNSVLEPDLMKIIDNFNFVVLEILSSNRVECFP